MANAWKVTLKKDCHSTSYSGSLQDVLEKADAVIAANKKAIESTQIFIKLARRELKAGGKV